MTATGDYTEWLGALQNLPDWVRKSAELRFALEAFEAAYQGRYTKFFKLLNKATYLQACLMHSAFPLVRKEGLKRVLKSMLQKERIPLADIVRWFAFNDEDDAAAFVTQWTGVEVTSHAASAQPSVAVTATHPLPLPPCLLTSFHPSLLDLQHPDPPLTLSLLLWPLCCHGAASPQSSAEQQAFQLPSPTDALAAPQQLAFCADTASGLSVTGLSVTTQIVFSNEGWSSGPTVRGQPSVPDRQPPTAAGQVPTVVIPRRFFYSLGSVRGWEQST